MLSLLVKEISHSIDNFKRDCDLLSLPLGSNQRIQSLKLEIQESVQKYWSRSSPHTLQFDMNSKSLKRLNILTKIRGLLKTKLYNAERRNDDKTKEQEDLKTYLSRVENEIGKLGVSFSSDPYKEQFNASLYSVSATEKSFAPNFTGIEMLKNVRAQGQEIERKLREKSCIFTDINETKNEPEQSDTQDSLKAEQNKPAQQEVTLKELSVQKIKDSEGIVSPSPIDFKSKTELLNLMELNNQELEKGSEHNYPTVENKIEEEKEPLETLEQNNLSQVQDQQDDSFTHSEIYLPSLATETQNSILEEENKDFNIEIKVDVVSKKETAVSDSQQAKPIVKKTKDFLKRDSSKKRIETKKPTTPRTSIPKFKAADRPASVKQKVTVLQKKAPKPTSRGASSIIKGGSTSHKQIEVSCPNVKGLLSNLQELEEERGGSQDCLSLLESQRKV